jgi:tartrate-resistant acid phosphatase type 5
LASCLLSACTQLVSPGPQPTSTSPAQEAPAEAPATSEVFLPYTVNQDPTSPPTTTITLTPEPDPSLTPTLENKIRFAVIGDYGLASQPELEVAALIASWQPDLIITTGDNNYPDGEASTIDENIGQYYSEYINPYQGAYGPGGDRNRFYPSLGNHDWTAPGAEPYLDYFTLPGNERYYDFEAGPVHFFALNSDWREPDGVSSQSIQADWLQTVMSASTVPWQIVYFHATPYSSGMQGSTEWMRWPFKEWGADAVLAGHDHDYERLLVDGLVYFVNGLGGGPIYYFEDILDSSQFRYNDNHGAMLVEATNTQIVFQFWNRSGQLIDEYRLDNTP